MLFLSRCMQRCFTNDFMPKINYNLLSHKVKLMIYRVIKCRKRIKSIKVFWQFIAMGLIYLIKVYDLSILWNTSLILFKIWLSHAFMSLLLQSTKAAKNTRPLHSVTSIFLLSLSYIPIFTSTVFGILYKL